MDEFFSSVETETFKMDSILAEMRGVEADLGTSREEAWPTQFAKNIEKQVIILFYIFTIYFCTALWQFLNIYNNYKKKKL